MAASELAGSYALPALVSGRFVIGSARARGARIRLVHDAAGWGFSGPSAPADEAPTVLPDLRILHVTVEDGRAAVILADATPPQRFVLSSLGLEAGFAMDSRTIRIDVATLHGVPRGLDVSPLSAKGTDHRRGQRRRSRSPGWTWRPAAAGCPATCGSSPAGASTRTSTWRRCPHESCARSSPRPASGRTSMVRSSRAGRGAGSRRVRRCALPAPAASGCSACAMPPAPTFPTARGPASGTSTWWRSIPRCRRAT